jgi:hypothetical protein
MFPKERRSSKADTIVKTGNAACAGSRNKASVTEHLRFSTIRASAHRLSACTALPGADTYSLLFDPHIYHNAPSLQHRYTTVTNRGF